MRTFRNYYAQKEVYGQDPGSDPPVSIQTIIFIGHRMQNLLLEDPQLRSDLGLLLETDVSTSWPEGTPVPTFLDLFSGKDASRIGVFREFNLTLVPVDAAKQVPPFGAEYPTSISYSSDVTPSKAAATLYKMEWKFGLGADKAKYKVKKNSIKDRRQKANTPTYNI